MTVPGRRRPELNREYDGKVPLVALPTAKVWASATAGEKAGVIAVGGVGAALFIVGFPLGNGFLEVLGGVGGLVGVALILMPGITRIVEAERSNITAVFDDLPDFTPTALLIPGMNARHAGPGLHERDLPQCAIGIDVGQNKLAILKLFRGSRSQNLSIFDAHEVLQSEVVEDGVTVSKTSTTRVIGGAVLGALLMGGAGAVVGGLGGRRINSSEVSRIDLRVTVDDMESPIRMVTIRGGGDKSARRLVRGSAEHREVLATAQKWQARISVLIRRGDAEAPKPVSTTLSGELSKLAELHERGVLSASEFESAKANVLKQRPD